MSFTWKMVLGTSAVLVMATMASAGVDWIEITHLKKPGFFATDKRVPELGDDLTVLARSKISMAKGIQQASQTGPVIEAKFELDGHKQLSLSLYPVGEKLDKDAERNKFQELAGDPTLSPFKGSLEVFSDQEHVLRSARDLTLVQLSRVTLLQAVQAVQSEGFVYWAIPTIRHGRAGYGIYTTNGLGQSRYHFVDGGGSHAITWWPKDLGTGPGALATDTRTPELGPDPKVVRASKISMSQALAQVEAKHGAVIEAKFELDHAGKLSLSVYPVGKGIRTDAERNTFFEAAGDPTKLPFTPALEEFKMPDFEHVARSSRDLTIVQTASLTLREAVALAEARLPDGFVFWAIPTIRDTRSGYGIYVLDQQNAVHYFFVS